MTVFCPNCGKPNTDNANKCVSCGTELAAAAAARGGAKFKGTMMMSGTSAPRPPGPGAAPGAPPPPAPGAPPPPAGGGGPVQAGSPAAKQSMAYQKTMLGPMTPPGAKPQSAPPPPPPPASQGGFGAQPPPSQGGFGAQPPASQGGFGAQPPPSQGGFGAQPPASGGFGAHPPSTGGFGAQPPASGGSQGGFGAQPSAGFGGADGSQPGFGAQPPTEGSQGGFGASQQGGGGWGQPPQGGGGFGAPPQGGAPPGGGGFGGPPQGGGFGGPPQGGAPPGGGGFGGPPAGGPGGSGQMAGPPPKKSKKGLLFAGLGCVLLLIIGCIVTAWLVCAAANEGAEQLGTSFQAEASRISLVFALGGLRMSCTSDPSGAGTSEYLHPNVAASLQGQACQVTDATIDAFGDAQRSQAQMLPGTGDESYANNVGVDPAQCTRFTSGSAKIIGCSLGDAMGFKIIHLENLASVQ